MSFSGAMRAEAGIIVARFRLPRGRGKARRRDFPLVAIGGAVASTHGVFQ
jgi:hypothetical protein